MQDWNNYRDSLISRVGDYAKIAPDVMRALSAIDVGVSKMGHLDAKTHEMIALAVAVTTRCDGCIAVHAKKAIDLGVTREEIAEALSVAISLNAGAALTYTARVLEAVDTLPNK
ncbi:carboxymuconolactone decarboxylase family protein [Acinetobacter sp.]|jgi:AhpD family alkylhydroperoxidase|uniref:carboxymuconolactone decarboxylase family protein n=1 Tax=Acinetobacter sp. TaxID=472 RepID=UPI002827A24A|nr:carboxymuconolactone decarboxylase family protein [Acinetobacter sp.]MDR0235749.1 carboxymuconolactone decarboxylase family protein [Acinetobacter sp.]